MLRLLFPEASGVREVLQNDTESTIRLENKVVCLGKPSGLLRYIAFTRNGAWIKPKVGTIMSDSRKILALAYERSDHRHVTLQPLNGPSIPRIWIEMSENLVTVHSEKSKGSVAIRLTESFVGFPIPTSADEYAQKEECVPAFNHREVSSLLQEPMRQLGFCTWNSLGLAVSHDTIISLLESLSEADIHPSFVVIDDGWQTFDENRRLTSIRANSSFHFGLKATVDVLKLTHGVEKVFVWSAAAGYWNGVSEFNFRRYNLWEVRRTDDTVCFIPGSNGVDQFYCDYFEYLALQGISGIKIDNLNFLDEIIEFVNPPMSETEGCRRLFMSYVDSIQRQALRFNLMIEWCMGMVPFILNTGHSKKGIVKMGYLRNSDDFYPDLKDSQAWHLYCNFYNSIWTRQFKHPLDFDMFQSAIKGVADDDEFARFPTLHAVARAMSNGPIYITDYKGFHNRDVIAPLYVCASESKQWYVPQFSYPPSVLDPYLPFDAGAPIRVLNRAQYGVVVAYFNLSHKSLTAIECAIPKYHATRSYNMKLVETFTRTQEDHDWLVLNSIFFDLLPYSWEVITHVALQTWGDKDANQFAIFGYIDKYIGITAVEKILILSTNQVQVHLLGGYGTLGVYSSCPLSAAADTGTLDVQKENNLYMIHVPTVISSILLTRCDL